MKAVSRILKTSLALAAVPLLSATLGCNECEDVCQEAYGDCNSRGVLDDSARCRVEWDECVRSCDAEPSGWDRLPV